MSPLFGIDRSSPPPPGERRQFRFPSFRKSQLRPGLQLYASRLPKAPLVSLQLLMPGGAHYQGPTDAGLATLTASMLDEGTDLRTGPQIAQEVERLGGYVASAADWDSAYVTTGLLSDHLEHGLELLGELALLPSFPPREIERLRSRRLTEIVRRRTQPSTLAEERFYRAVYGETAYASPLVGLQETVSRFQRPDIESYYRRHLCRSGSALVAVGDLEPERVAEKAGSVFRDWPPGEPPPLPKIRPALGDQTQVHVVERAGAAQTELRLGHAGIPRRHPDRVPLMVMNSLLGGKFTSRINLNLRERHGFTYGAQSRFLLRHGPGPFVISAAVATSHVGAAVHETLGELRRLQHDEVDDDEIEESRSYLQGVFPYTLQTVDDLARRLGELAIYGLTDDHFDRDLEEIAKVDGDAVLAVAQRHLRPDCVAIVAVGPSAELVPQLRRYGPVRVWKA